MDNSAKPKEGFIYRHFKGGVYTVIDSPKDSATGKSVSLIGYAGDEVVWYRSTTDGQIWVRSLSEWNEIVDLGDKQVSRFQKIG